MSKNRVSFSINLYDSEGCRFDSCLLIHVGNVIIRFENLEELNDFVNQLKSIAKELEDDDSYYKDLFEMDGL